MESRSRAMSWNWGRFEERDGTVRCGADTKQINIQFGVRTDRRWALCRVVLCHVVLYSVASLIYVHVHISRTPRTHLDILLPACLRAEC